MVIYAIAPTIVIPIISFVSRIPLTLEDYVKLVGFTECFDMLAVGLLVLHELNSRITK